MLLLFILVLFYCNIYKTRNYMQLYTQRRFVATVDCSGFLHSNVVFLKTGFYCAINGMICLLFVQLIFEVGQMLE